MKETWSWLAAFVILGLSAMLISQPMDSIARIAICCLAVFLSEALSDRWFAFIAAFLPLLGLLNDANGIWVMVTPTLTASFLGCLIVKQYKPSIFTLIARSAIFALPAFVLQLLSTRLGSNISLPGGEAYAITQAVIGCGTIILGGLILAYRRSFSVY